MKHASITPDRTQDIASTTTEVREKLHAVLSILDTVGGVEPSAEHASAQPVTERQIQGILQARRRRTHFFSADLFADPAWDMLLELYAADLGQRRMSVSSLCLGSGVPATTALRWINTLEKNGLLIRAADPLDGRRVFVRLSEIALTSMTSYFAVNSACG